MSEHRNSPPDFGEDDDQMFKSATLPVTDDVPLSEDDDDDDDNPFGEPSGKNKTPLTIPPITVPEPQSPTPVKQETQSPTPVKQETQFFSSDSGMNSTEKNTSIIQPVHATTLFESQFSSSKPIASENTNITTDVKSVRKRSNEHNIEITVSDPTKVGEVCLLFILNKILKIFLH